VRHRRSRGCRTRPTPTPWPGETRPDRRLAGRPAEPLIVVRGVGHVQSRAVEGDHPPTAVPRTLRLRCGDRLGDLGEQRRQRLRAQAAAGVDQRGARRDGPGAGPHLRPQQPLDQQRCDFHVGLAGPQAQRQHEVHRHPRRQLADALLACAGRLDHPVHQLGRERGRQHTDRDEVRQPLLQYWFAFS